MDGKTRKIVDDFLGYVAPIAGSYTKGSILISDYDALGRTVFTGGDTYLLRFGYNTVGHKTSGWTTRDGGAGWDVTHWEFDPASGVNTAKDYADGSRIAYANQYSSISTLCVSAPLREAIPVYDTDGNLVQDDRFAYSYDAENRLVSATSSVLTNGAIRVLNAYDHKHRRIVKRVESFDGDDWQTSETHTFAYDGCNIVLERIAFANGTTRTCEYFWGPDKSGTEQGAGGVGGLHAVSIDGAFYLPCYDHNGNIVCYVSETGAIAAQYVYEPYGNIIETVGPSGDLFSFGFSTKYHDRETDMIAYQRRFYRPDLGRWLNRDPIEEEGGENLYAFCANAVPFKYDKNGCAYFALRKLKGFYWIPGFSSNPVLDILNLEVAHELLFFEDGKAPSDVGFSDQGVNPELPSDLETLKYYKTDGGYNDCVMRKAQHLVYFAGHDYSVFWFAPHAIKCNCQDYATALRYKYHELMSDKKVRCECGIGPNKEYRRVDFYRGGKPVYEK